MKKLVLVFLFATSVIAHAQKLRFTDPGNHWITMGEVEEASFGQYFGLGPDTVMYLHTYRPMLDTSYYYYGSSEYHYWVREDTIANIVYYREPESDTMEHVLYNYNLQVGDSISYTSWGAPLDSVASIDSVIIRGIYHKVFTMFGKNYDRAYTLIEGIGATNSPIWPAFFTNGPEYSERLLCFRQDTFMPQVVTPYYMYIFAEGPDSFHNGAEDCYPLSVTDLTKASLQFYPNPATTQLTILSTGQPINEITITNLLGQKIYTRNYGTEKVQVDVSGLSPGVYFIKINGTEVRKFVKE